MILLALWRRGLLGRVDGEKLRYFLGRNADDLSGADIRHALFRESEPLGITSPFF